MWEREQLLDAGLGEHKLTFNDLDCSAEEYKKVLIDNFPKLCDSGGYELMRCCPNSRLLECISASALQSPQSTQERVGRSKVYIRPILDVTPVENEENFESKVRKSSVVFANFLFGCSFNRYWRNA